MSMPTQSHIEENAKDDGTVSKKLVIEFSNGSLEQLKVLAKYYKIKDSDPYEFITFAIGVLEKIKENNETKKAPEADF